MRPANRFLSIFASAWVTCTPGALADDLTQAEVEQRLEQLKAEIRTLQDTLTSSRQRFSSEQEKLRSLDLKVQSAALALRDIEGRISQQESRLAELRDDREAYLNSLDERRDALSRQIVDAYRMGRESRLKLLLNQDSPARLGRMLAYYEYYNGAQIGRIEELRTALAGLERLQQDIDATLDELHTEQARQNAGLEELQGRRDARRVMLAQIEREIETGSERLEELSRNQADLEALLRRLVEALSNIPTELGQYQHPRDIKGQLPMPLAGRVRRAFGQVRAGGMRWQGWLIAAKQGAEVESVAYGRVAYADWLRGYGLLMIIDHGDGFMSLYGNNEALLFEPGDWVQPGEVIATVGDQPGDEQGLYFELRNKGRAIDPAAWIDRN